MKNILLMEAKAANAGMKFIIRDTAQVREHTGTVCLRLKLGRNTDTQRKSAGVLPNEECSKAVI